MAELSPVQRIAQGIQWTYGRHDSCYPVIKVRYDSWNVVSEVVDKEGERSYLPNTS